MSALIAEAGTSLMASSYRHIIVLDMNTSVKEEELYGELLRFLTIYLVDLSSHENTHLPSRTLFSPKIKGHLISHSGISNWDWLSGLLTKLKITKINDSGLNILCQDGEDIKVQFSASPRPDILTLEYMLEVFIDLCGGYGPCIILGTRNHFQISSDYEGIFQQFSKYGYVEQHPMGFLWTNKMSNALARNSV